MKKDKRLLLLLIFSVLLNFIQYFTTKQDWLYGISWLLGEDSTKLANTFSDERFKRIYFGNDRELVKTLIGEPLSVNKSCWISKDYLKMKSELQPDNQLNQDCSGKPEIEYLNYGLQMNPTKNYKERTVILIDGKVVQTVSDYFLE